MTDAKLTGPASYVWDASALHDFAKAERLDVLGAIVAGPRSLPWSHCITDIVADELDRYGLAPPDWCELVSVEELSDVAAFARWTALMSDGIHDLGEASVAAWASTHNQVAIIDDYGATLVARRNGCEAHGSAWLLCQCILLDLVDRSSASSLLDAAIASGARYPFSRGGFIPWAVGHALLPA